MTPLEIAVTQIGVKEDPIGSNWGLRVKEYLASVGIDFQASWCMAFCYWCCDQAELSQNGSGHWSNPLIKTGGVLRQWNEINDDYKYTRPMVGDIFIMDFGGGLGHCGFVRAIDRDSIHTVEGNTNDTGSREGYEVCRRIRKIKDCKGFIRVIQ